MRSPVMDRSWLRPISHLQHHARGPRAVADAQLVAGAEAIEDRAVPFEEEGKVIDSRLGIEGRAGGRVESVQRQCDAGRGVPAGGTTGVRLPTTRPPRGPRAI